MILIGSRAAAMQAPDIFTRKTHDWDFVATKSEADQFIKHNEENLEILKVDERGKYVLQHKMHGIIEIEFSDNRASGQILQELCRNVDSFQFLDMTVQIAPLQLLYLTKKAHRHNAWKWHKTVIDYLLLKNFATDFSDQELTYYEERYKEFSKPTPSLMQSNESFFGQSRNIEYTYPHDAIHCAVAFGNEPVFSKLKHDQKLAWCAKDLWEKLDHNDQLNCVREEVMVIALERLILPKKETDPVKAWQWAHQRVGTTLCSGWFREFAIDHFLDLYQPNCDYVSIFSKNIDDVIESGCWRQYMAA